MLKVLDFKQLHAGYIDGEHYMGMNWKTAAVVLCTGIAAVVGGALAVYGITKLASWIGFMVTFDNVIEAFIAGAAVFGFFGYHGTVRLGNKLGIQFDP